MKKAIAKQIYEELENKIYYEFLDFYETPIEEADADGHSYAIDCYTHNLKSCGVGYRAPYMKKASKILIEDIDFFNNIFGNIRCITYMRT